MRVSTRFAGCCAALAIALVAMAIPCCAQEGGIEADAEEAAVESAHEAEEAEHGDASAGPNPLAWDPDLAIWTLIVFVLLFLILKKFAWPQIAEAIDERERKIANEIAAAKATNEEARRLLAEYDARLAAAAGEVRAMLEEARRDAEHTKSQIVEEGRKAASDEAARAVREIERAKEGAIQDLAVRSANTAIELARSVVRDQLSPDQQKSLVQEALSKLTTATPSKN